MKKMDLGQTIGILANVGVLAGIVFLGIEIRQNTGEIRSQASLNINNSLARTQNAIYEDPELADILIRARESLSNLDPVEYERFRAYYIQRINVAIYIYDLERADTDGVHIDYIDLMAREIENNPGIREMFFSLRDGWPGPDELYERLARESNDE